MGFAQLALFVALRPTAPSAYARPWPQTCARRVGRLTIPQVFEDGGGDSALSVDNLAMSNSSLTWAYDDAGTHFLQINSEMRPEGQGHRRAVTRASGPPAAKTSAHIGPWLPSLRTVRPKFLTALLLSS